jgi:hypothetical protein
MTAVLDPSAEAVDRVAAAVHEALAPDTVRRSIVTTEEIA